MRVTAAQNNFGGKYSPNGVSINFTISPSSKFLPLRTILKLSHNLVEHFFILSNVTTSTIERGHHFLECTATEYTKPNNRFKEDFDPRLLIDNNIEVVEDPEVIRKVMREANYC